MRKNYRFGLILSMVLSLMVTTSLSAQNGCVGNGSYVGDGDENTNCGMGICCQVWNACNGPYSPCYNYDPDYSATGGCDLSCAPIDSGVLFLLLGGAAFGGMMIMRRRQEVLEVIKH